MKKLLLGTTALVLLSGAAAAQQVTTTSPFTVKLGGSVRYDFALFDEDASNVNRESRIDTRISIKAEAKADNGLVYGFAGRLRTAGGPAGGNGVSMDYKYLYAEGTWGTVNLGDYSDARTQQEVLLYTVGIGQADYAPFAAFGNNTMYWATEDNVATKITYLTPSFSGFQAGVSYTPEFDSGRGITKRNSNVDADGDGVPDLDATDYADYFDVAASYTGTFGGFGVKVGGGLGVAATKRTDIVGDSFNWNVGAQLSYAGFTGSAFYLDNGEFTLGDGADQYAWGLGIAYEIGQWGVGASYVMTRTDLVGSARTDDQTIGIGAAYKVAPGLSLQADANWLDAESANNDGLQLVVRTRLDF